MMFLWECCVVYVFATQYGFKTFLIIGQIWLNNAEQGNKVCGVVSTQTVTYHI